MPLNIGATGSIKPYVKFNAKADKWFAKGETGDVEIGDRPSSPTCPTSPPAGFASSRARRRSG